MTTTPDPGAPDENPDPALKKPAKPSKTARAGGCEAKEARLGAALRENLRRRKGAARKKAPQDNAPQDRD